MSDAQATSGAAGTSATTASATAASDPSKGGTAPNPKDEITGATRIETMEDLKKLAPDLYKKMMEGIANTIVNKMRRNQDRLKKIWRENRDRAGIQT